MDKVVNTKKELKAAIKDKVDTIIIGDEKLAKKILRVRKPKKVVLQPSNIVNARSKLAVSGGTANVPSSIGAGTLAGAEVIVLVAIVILGALIAYALTIDYDVELEGHGGTRIDENGMPKANYGGKVILKRKK